MTTAYETIYAFNSVNQVYSTQIYIYIYKVFKFKLLTPGSTIWL